MIVFDAETKILDTEIFPQHTIADLNSGFTTIVLFNQEKPLQWTTHSHTHTHTHKHTQTRPTHVNTSPNFSAIIVDVKQQNLNMANENIGSCYSLLYQLLITLSSFFIAYVIS